MTVVRQNLPLLGRILLGLIFVLSGVFKIPGWEGTLGYIAAKGVPFAPLFLIAAVIVEIGAGFALILGYQARIAAALLAVFSVVAALIFHSFWAFAGFEQQAEMANFLKNLSIAGGMLFVVTFGPGGRIVGTDPFAHEAAAAS